MRRKNRELLEAGGRPVGLEGFFDVGVEIPFFNRNQGNVSAARANLDRAEREIQRVKLSLRMRMARVYKEYQDASITADRYRTQMIPRAQQAYDLYLNNFRQMAAASPPGVDCATQPVSTSAGLHPRSRLKVAQRR